MSTNKRQIISIVTNMQVTCLLPSLISVAILRRAPRLFLFIFQKKNTMQIKIISFLFFHKKNDHF